jgi:hypothetical protein
MKGLVLATVLLVSATVLGATAEAQQLPKSGKYTGKFGAEGVGQTYELRKVTCSLSACTTAYSLMTLPMVFSTKPR